MTAARNAAASLGEILSSPATIGVQKAKVTVVNAGPPLSVDVLIENNFTVQRVRYMLSYATPAVDDAVYVLTYGAGRRLVLGEEA